MNNIHNAGWFEDSTGRNLRRYWDGAQWTAHVQSHDGTSTLDPIAPLAPAAAAPRNTPPLTAKIVFGGLIVATAATFLPWEQDTGPLGERVTATPADTGTLGMLVVLLAATAWVAWPTIASALSIKRRVLLTLLAGSLSLMAVAKFLGLSEAQAKIDGGDSTTLFGTTDMTKYGAGVGLLLFCGAMAFMWVGVVRTWIARRSRNVSGIVSFPPPAASR